MYSSQQKIEIYRDYIENNLKVVEIIQRYGCCRGTLFKILREFEGDKEPKLKYLKFKGEAKRRINIITDNVKNNTKTDDVKVLDISACRNFGELNEMIK